MSDKQIQEALQLVVDKLNKLAGPDDMASILINNLGVIHFGVGVSARTSMSIEQFVQEVMA